MTLPLNREQTYGGGNKLTEKRTMPATWCVFLLAGDTISPLVDLLSDFF